jgi:hypothetical protein
VRKERIMMTTTDDQATEDAAEDAEEWLTAGEAAEHLGISPFTLRGLTRRGELVAYASPLDRRMKFFRVEELDALEMEAIPNG